MSDDKKRFSADPENNILSSQNLEAIRKELDDEGPVIVEHWIYYGGCSPNHYLFYDFDDFVKYLKANVKPGDAIDVWSFHNVCNPDNALTRAKYPDKNGHTPLGGAY